MSEFMKKYNTIHSIRYKAPSGVWFEHTGTRLGIHELLRGELSETEFRSSSTPKFTFLTNEELKELAEFQGERPKKKKKKAKAAA